MKNIRTISLFLMLILLSSLLSFNFNEDCQELFSSINTVKAANNSQLPAKIPHLRNEMTTPGLIKFKDTVARQALIFPNDYFLEALDYDKVIALTFDDGPDDIFTPKILDILKKYNIKATFFLIGEKSLQYPEITQRIKAEGHAIGNHSLNHPDLRKLTTKNAYYTQILITQEILEEQIGYQPAFYRPPYGAVTDDQIAYFAQQGLKAINWSIDSFDWDKNQNSVQEIQHKIFNYLHEGAIILMHSAGGDRSNTVNSLSELIETIQKKGYTFQTIPQMLGFEQIK